MYKQTDEEVSIHREVRDEKTGVLSSYNVMEKWGCLYASLLYLIEIQTEKAFSPSQVKLLFDYLVSIKAMREDMYVLNHEKVLYNGCRILGYEPREIKYLAKVDYEYEEETWGTMDNYTDKLMEMRIRKGVVHFKHRTWNPYPDLKGKVISKRYYKIII